MSRRNRQTNHPPETVTTLSAAKRFFGILGITTGATAAIVASSVGIAKIVGFKNMTDSIMSIALMLGIYVYIGLDATDKAKKWGFIKVPPKDK